MKKFLSCLAALLALASCNDEVGPEYTTRPEFGTVTYTPAVVTESDKVSVSVPISCQYGLASAWVVYALNDDFQNLKAVSQYFFKGEAETSATYRAANVIPEQRIGTKVTFQVQAATPYGVLGLSEPVTYTVTDGAGDTPAEPEAPETSDDSGASAEN